MIRAQQKLLFKDVRRVYGQSRYVKWRYVSANSCLLQFHPLHPLHPLLLLDQECGNSPGECCGDWGLCDCCKNQPPPALAPSPAGSDTFDQMEHAAVNRVGAEQVQPAATSDFDNEKQSGRITRYTVR